MMRRSTDPRLFGAAALLATGVLVFGATLARAVTVTLPTTPAPEVPVVELPAGPDNGEPAASTPDAVGGDGPADGPLPHSALMLAVDHDPFRPDRQRAPERYRLPGDELPEPPPPPPGPPPPPPFRLVGTAVTPAGGLAMLQLEDTPPRMVSMGESLLGYTVTRVTDEGAVLEGQQGQVLSLLLSRAVAVGDVARGAGGRQPQGRGAPAQGNAREAAAVRERVEAIQRMMQGSEQSPELMEAMRRLLQIEAGGAAGQWTTTTTRSGSGATGEVIIRRNQPDSSRPPNPDR